MAQQAKDLALSLQSCGSMLWCSFDHWPGNFHMPQVKPKKKFLGTFPSLNMDLSHATVMERKRLPSPLPSPQLSSPVPFPTSGTERNTGFAALSFEAATGIRLEGL